jgi:hypothetical protein
MYCSTYVLLYLLSNMEILRNMCFLAVTCSGNLAKKYQVPRVRIVGYSEE